MPEIKRMKSLPGWTPYLAEGGQSAWRKGFYCSLGYLQMIIVRLYERRGKEGVIYHARVVMNDEGLKGAMRGNIREAKKFCESNLKTLISKTIKELQKREKQYS